MTEESHFGSSETFFLQCIIAFDLIFSSLVYDNNMLNIVGIDVRKLLGLDQA